MQRIDNWFYKHYILFLAGITFLYAFLMPDRQHLLSGYVKLLFSSIISMQDVLSIAGISATFFNLGTLLLFVYALYHINQSKKITGLHLSALGIFIGHSFFGLHLFNVLPIILGVKIYAMWTKQSFKRFVNVSVFATASAPIVSYFLAQVQSNFWMIFVGVFSGVLVGVLSPVLAEHFLKFHQGFTLYNFGFTTGILMMFMMLLFPYFKFEIDVYYQASTQYSNFLMIYFIIILALTFLVYLSDRLTALKQIKGLLNRSGRVPDDFVSRYALSTVGLNLFLTGSLYLIILLTLRVTFSGPILAGLFTILGFAAFGKTVKNSFPVSVGVVIAALLLGQDITQLNVVLPLMFGTALAPIAGYYGVLSGVVAGFFHFNLTSTVFYLHGGLTLYNNGFSSGFVAAFLVPIIDTIIEHQPNKL